jgi:cytochrome c
MRAVLRLFAVATLILSIVPTSASLAGEDRGTPAEAQAMAEKAAALVQSDGFDKATAAFTAANGPFRDRDLYVFMWNTEGKSLFNAGSPALVGKTLIDMKDAGGTPIIRNLIAIPDRGWISYSWPNPISHKVEAKVAYIIAIGDTRLGVGAYK